MSFIPNKITSKLGVLALQASKASPKLLFVGGIVGIATTVVLASRSTLKLENVVETAKDKLDDINTFNVGESDKAIARDKALVYLEAAVTITKLYGPSFVLGAVSIGMLAGSNHILTKRNAALTAAYATLEKAFKEYRSRVAEDLGEEKEREYRNGVKKYKETVIDADGKKTQVEKKVATASTEYGRLFHNGNPNWNPNPEYNYLFLRCIQKTCNDRLQANGFLLLNDVYDELGFDRSRAGLVVGWMADNSGKYGDNDGFIDFGIWDDGSQVHSYMIGREGELHLNFNVDGNIYDKV